MSTPIFFYCKHLNQVVSICIGFGLEELFLEIFLGMVAIL